jgi:uncharacterized protein YkwD
MTGDGNKNINIVPAVTIIALVVVSLTTFVSSYASEITSENIVNAVNKEREARFLQPLKVNPRLETAAKKKSTDMIVRNYFEHYAFNMSPWAFILNEGYQYSVAGENLAMGYKTAEGVVGAWMNSPAHRANILNPEFQEIGVGVVKGEYNDNGQAVDTTLTTEMSATPKPVVTQIFERITQAFSDLFQ